MNYNQLSSILKEVFTALDVKSKLWIAYPKVTSKIASDLNRDCSWQLLSESDFEAVDQVALDHVWTAMLFKKATSESSPSVLKVKPKSLLTEV